MPEVTGKNKVAVIGGAQVDQKTFQLAVETGERLAEAGFILYNGGKSGVMEAVSMGAKTKGGVVVGILPDDDTAAANPFVDIPVATGMGIGRNVIIIRSADAVIAIDGKYGTLSEIAYALQLGKPVIGLNTWELEAPVIRVKNPEEAVQQLISVLEA